MNEAETRAEHIDPALRAAGWGVVEGSRVRREYPITLGRIEGAGRRGKALKADYILEYRNTKLAVVEAKAWDLALTEGVGQAKDYAQRLKIRYAYSSNGQGFYGIDMMGEEGEITAIPGPEELWRRTFATENAWRDRFAAVPFEDKGGTFQGRYYQDNAINAVLAALEEKKSRILLTLATGTGKTFIAFQLAWKLFYSRWNTKEWGQEGAPTRRPRILFLADRNVLANQAFNSFSAFPEDALVRIAPEEIKKKGSVPKNGSIFFTIFQTFMSGPPKDGKPSPYFGEYPPDFFDFIIIDECHRGGAQDESTWRAILEYFSPAVQLGLTATPKRKDNADTYAYFGEPVFVYSLKDGINDGFLTPFRVKQYITSMDEYIYTPDDTVKGEVEKGKVYTAKDFNRTIVIPERERKRVEFFMKEMKRHEKAIVFCANQDHALAIRDCINQLHPGVPDFCKRVTADDGELGDQALRDFQDNEKTLPTILTTSQKLSTGVDARNVRHIVLLRPVNSMIEFKQIIGRGTRLYDGKDYFTIHDFEKAHHHFSDPEWDGEPEPDVCKKCQVSPCVCEAPPVGPCKRCGKVLCECSKDCTVCSRRPCECVRVGCPKCGRKPCVCPLTTIILADGKARRIKHMIVTSFWHPDGTPLSAQQFMEMLFGKLPEHFKDEAELKRIWSEPESRQKLLDRLAESGFGKDQLSEMQKLIEAEDSDLYDVLAHVAYALPPLTRVDRAGKAKKELPSHFNAKQQAFLDFVLEHYVQEGVDELELKKIRTLLELKYHSLSDAEGVLGRMAEVRKLFVGFQRYLYDWGA